MFETKEKGREVTTFGNCTIMHSCIENHQIGVDIITLWEDHHLLNDTEQYQLLYY